MSTASGGRAGPAAVELTDVSKSFDDVRVLDALSLRVEEGAVHALLGGNGSGKSTTLKILAGVYGADDGGAIAIHGRRYATGSYTAAVARSSGLRFVHQDLGLVPDLTISENFALDEGYPRWAGPAISWRRLHGRTEERLRRAQVDLDPRTLVRDLRPSDRTLVAIARALRDADEGERVTLVLDEPTASLPHHEVSLLLEALRRCRARGQTIIYVSHRLREVLSIADRISVLRDGAVVATAPPGELDEARVVALMAGEAARERAARRAPGRKVPPRGGAAGTPILRVRDLAGGPLRGVDLEVGQGEIVGVAGLLGSGRSSLLQALFGVLPVDAGRIEICGAPGRHRTVAAAIGAGIALVPEDRARDAAFADRPVWENMSATVVGDYWAGWRMARRAERRDAAALLEPFAVRAAGPDVAFGALSGGNQQKAVLARWFRLNPRLLLLDEPTQGVDAVARAEIHALIREHVAGGNAALVVSSDFEELEGLCDRVVILREGVDAGELSGDRLTEAAIAAATQTT
ncbi:sugar ABC transporter ATP-binding protein [Actinomadura mexicana]|uniref:Monosaccharide ABC transporter ATP-binding protein, CUT2 family n=1 Tax=Actinomadura mexicana TaxID=134959 RepID=A0A238X9Y7_9ACTN|nr:sugar ABC transporter ATP-binding protein [Actinomadura mexicana]SNR55381.1 monosaccharide ABC transporter ATP-binding protein, CUT2 family [Actinomadura mexicana]